jgi:hypothetical protein
MSVQHANRGVVKKDLQLYYNREFPKSFRGQATTNIAYATNSFLNSNSNWWVNSGNTVFNDNDTTIDKPVILNVDTSNLRIFSSTVTVVGNQQLGSSIIPISGSTQYSMSIYYWFSGGSMQAPPYVRANINNNELAYFGYNGDTNYLNWPRRTWIRLTATFTTQANETGVYMSSYTGDTAGEKLAYFGYQIEQKAYVTPLVLGSRTANTVAGGGGLLDISGNNVNADLTNVSFNSSGYFFNGSSNYIDLGSDVTFKTSGGWSVSSWFNLTQVNSGNLYNFIGASAITYNSWYWTVYQSNLALWNMSPGGWYYGSTTIQANTWYNAVLVCSYDGTKYQMYLNGVAEGGTHTSYTWNSDYSGLKVGYIGRGDSSNGRYFYGAYPDFKIYRKELTASEVLQNFNATRATYGI